MKSMFCASAVALLCAVSLAQPCRAEWEMSSFIGGVDTSSVSKGGDGNVGGIGNIGDEIVVGIEATAGSDGNYPSSFASGSGKFTVRYTWSGGGRHGYPDPVDYKTIASGGVVAGAGENGVGSAKSSSSCDDVSGSASAPTSTSEYDAYSVYEYELPPITPIGPNIYEVYFNISVSADSSRPAIGEGGHASGRGAVTVVPAP